jgi:hypothetical protein
MVGSSLCAPPFEETRMIDQPDNKMQFVKPIHDVLGNNASAVSRPARHAHVVKVQQ